MTWDASLESNIAQHYTDLGNGCKDFSTLDSAALIQRHIYSATSTVGTNTSFDFTETSFIAKLSDGRIISWTTGTNGTKTVQKTSPMVVS